MGWEDSDSWEYKATANPTAAAPPVVYHYTTTAGLLGILNTQKIWATDLAYLNDAAELSYGMGLVLETVTKLLTSKSEFAYPRALVPMYASIFEIALQSMRGVISTFVTCFCEEPDLLGQWRGYAVGGGYAIGFDSAELRTRTSTVVSLPLVPVVYDPTQQADVIEAVTTRALTQLIELIERAGKESVLTRLLHARSLSGILGEAMKEDFQSLTKDDLLALFARCAQLKDPAFREEREWRLCDLTVIRSGKDVDFRAGHLGLIPYIKIPLSVNTQLLPIREVIIGPGPEPQLRVAAVRSMLTCHGYDAQSVDVRPSVVPFRPN
jgi:Protein of unknown function (DUF2971)